MAKIDIYKIVGKGMPVEDIAKRLAAIPKKMIGRKGRKWLAAANRPDEKTEGKDSSNG